MPGIETDQAIEAIEKKCRNLPPELNVIMMSFSKGWLQFQCDGILQ